MSSPQDRFKVRREQLLNSAPQPSKLDRPNEAAKATMEFLASLRDDQPMRLRTPAAAGDGWDKIEARLAGRKSQQNASQQSPQQEPRTARIDEPWMSDERRKRIKQILDELKALGLK